MNTETAICSGNCGLGADSSRIPSRDSTEEGGLELNPVTFHCLPVCSDTDHEMGLSLMLFVANFQHISNMVTCKRLLGELLVCSLNWLS
jgi:hypothetical protein